MWWPVSPSKEETSGPELGSRERTARASEGAGPPLTALLSPCCPRDQRTPTQTPSQPFPHCATLERDLNFLSLELLFCEMGSTTSLPAGAGGE